MASYDFDQDNARWLRRSMRWRKRYSPARRPRRCSASPDYYETYPLDVNIVLSDMFFWHAARGINWAGQDAMTLFIQDYSRSRAGRPVSRGRGRKVCERRLVGRNGQQNRATASFLYPIRHSGRRLLFLFSNRTRLGNLVDTSRVPGGYGVYRLPPTAGWTRTNPIKGQEDGWHNYDVFADQLEVYLRGRPGDPLSYLAASGDGTAPVPPRDRG